MARTKASKPGGGKLAAEKKARSTAKANGTKVAPVTAEDIQREKARIAKEVKNSKKNKAAKAARAAEQAQSAPVPAPVPAPVLPTRHPSPPAIHYPSPPPFGSARDGPPFLLPDAE